ncbi:MAG TPA: hypothetical protein VFH75_06785 [Actinomycetota bacterium]|nr:hypothetical protein [Actinomycetota bacterium]
MRRLLIVEAIVLLMLAPSLATFAAPGDTILVSASDLGLKANGDSRTRSLSADGTKVAFHSYADNLDPADTDTMGDVYVKDVATGDITLASTSDVGVKGNSDSFHPTISADGTKVAFQSRATNLGPLDLNQNEDIYIKDLKTGDLTLASTRDPGTQGRDDSGVFAALSADGNRVAFASYGRNLDADAPDGDFNLDIYVKDLSTGDVMLASITQAGVKGNRSSTWPAISDDGTSVAFESAATNLDPADADTAADVYVKDLTTGSLTLASAPDAGPKTESISDEVSLSSDGTRVAFRSFAHLDQSDTDALPDVYVRDVAAGSITLASTSDFGVKGDDWSGFPKISDDGTKVAFESLATNLDPTHTEGGGARPDLYVKDLVTGDITLASTSSGGVPGNYGSSWPAISADGTKVAFESHATNLHPADTDLVRDIYLKELAVADLSVSKTDSPSRVPVGRNLTYTVTVANGGPDAGTAVFVTDQLPPSATFVSATPSRGSFEETNGTITWAVGTLGSGTTATLEIVVNPRMAGTITNRVSVSATASDRNLANSVDYEDTTVCRITSRRSSIPCG